MYTGVVIFLIPPSRLRSPLKDSINSLQEGSISYRMFSIISQLKIDRSHKQS